MINMKGLLWVIQVEAAVQKSGPLHRLDAKLSEINAGLDAVHSRLKKKCPNVAEAESVQKVRLRHKSDSLICSSQLS